MSGLAKRLYRSNSSEPCLSLKSWRFKRFSQVLPVSTAVLFVSLLGGCAIVPSDSDIPMVISADRDRVSLDNQVVSEQRTSVLAKAIRKFGQPDCSSTKSGLINSRRASTIENCLFRLPANKVSYAGNPIRTVNYQFIDGRLLQMSLEFQRTISGASAIPGLRATLKRDLPLTQPVLSAGTTSYRVALDRIDILDADEKTGMQLKISDAVLSNNVIRNDVVSMNQAVSVEVFSKF